MKTVLVTGACGVVGETVWRTLMGQGYYVIGVDLADELPFQSAKADFRGGVDLTSILSVSELAEKLKREGFSLTGLVNIAGGFVWEETAGGSLGTWERMFQMNVLTAVNACQAFVPLLSGSASIINIGAAAADSADAGMGAYAASKASVLKLTEALKAELAPKQIRVNAISPTIVDTAINRADMPDANFDDWVSPQQLAELIAFLLSDQAIAINGENIRVRGRV